MSNYYGTELSSLSSSRGWGKEAAKRLNTKDQFKNDPLLRTLEGKIAVDFGDYKPWQRTTIPKYLKETQFKKRITSRPVSGRTSASAGSTLVVSKENTVKVGPRPYSAAYSAAASTACSSVCNHPWTKRPLEIDGSEERRKQTVLSILKVSLKSYKNLSCRLLYFKKSFSSLSLAARLSLKNLKKYIFPWGADNLHEQISPSVLTTLSYNRCKVNSN